MRIKEALGSRANELKKKGEDAQLYGIRAADMTRNELLMFLGLLGECHVEDAKKLNEVSDRLHGMVAKFEETGENLSASAT